MADSHDVIRVLTIDHWEIDELLGRLERERDHDARKDLANLITAELVRHWVSEEQDLYPLVTAYVPEGSQIAREAAAAHASMEHTLRALELFDAADPRFDPLAEAVIAEARAHFRDEEDRIFPALSTAVDQRVLDAAGERARLAKITAPTYERPPGSTRLPFRATPGMIERLRDALAARS